AVAAPEAAGADPEPRQQIVLAGLLGLFGRQLGVGLDQLGRRSNLLAVFVGDFDDRRLLVLLLALFAFSGRLLHARITRGKSNGSCRFRASFHSAAPSRTRRSRAARCSTRDSSS